LAKVAASWKSKRRELAERNFEDALHVLDSTVFLKTFADEWPREASFTQDLITEVDKDYRGVVLVDVHHSLCGSRGWDLKNSSRSALT
jgi:hypothetical protein